jgi:tetratricopeptide (TPR) repeat protein
MEKSKHSGGHYFFYVPLTVLVLSSIVLFAYAVFTHVSHILLPYMLYLWEAFFVSLIITVVLGLAQARATFAKPKAKSAEREETPHPAFCQLPNPPEDFTGRQGEINELRTNLKHHGIKAVLLHGQAGVGKTALALKLAEKIAPDFPDAQVYIDLRGSDPEPVPTIEAMAHVIRSFNREARLGEFEQNIGTLAGFYRATLNGKHVLLLLDNAADAAQVEPLIPPDGCKLLITSRTQFEIPQTHVMGLNLMLPHNARDMIKKIAPKLAHLDAEALAAVCGYLPFVVRTAASALAMGMKLLPPQYIHKLALDSESVGFTEAVLALSYESLSGDKQRLWRQLEVFPNTFDVAGAAAVCGLSRSAAADALDELRRWGLVEWNESTERYRLHDIAREYADGKLGRRLEAVQRKHAVHYAKVASEANELYVQGGSSAAKGLALFDQELDNIVAGGRWAAERESSGEGEADLCISYVVGAVNLMILRLQPHDQVSWNEAALLAARQSGDRKAEGSVLNNMGLTYDSLGEYRQAIDLFEQSASIAEENGDRQGYANALGNIGLAYHSEGDFDRAIDFYDKCLNVARSVGDQLLEVRALCSIGYGYYSLHEYQQAMDYYQRSRSVAERIRDRIGEARALGSLGIAYTSLREYARAVVYFERELNVLRESGDVRGEGNSLNNMGSAYNMLGDYGRAITFFQQSLVIARDSGDRLFEANILGNIGLAFYSQGDYHHTIDYYEQSLAVAKAIGNQLLEGNALYYKSLALKSLGKKDEALPMAKSAVQILEQAGSPNASQVRQAFGL